MKNLEEEHDKVEVHLKAIKQICVDMREEGLGGDDFEYLYLTNKLIPAITRIFKES